MENSSLFKEYEGVFKEDEAALKEKKAFFFAYSPFALQDAIGERNVKKIWIEYIRLRLQSIEADDLINKFLSKMRDMAMIANGATAQDLEIKDFPYNKSKRDLKNWKIEELKNFYTKLVEIYHFSRMGKVEIDNALEKAILSLN